MARRPPVRARVLADRRLVEPEAVVLDGEERLELEFGVAGEDRHPHRVHVAQEDDPAEPERACRPLWAAADRESSPAGLPAREQRVNAPPPAGLLDGSTAALAVSGRARRKPSYLSGFVPAIQMMTRENLPSASTSKKLQLCMSFFVPSTSSPM